LQIVFARCDDTVLEVQAVGIRQRLIGFLADMHTEQLSGGPAARHALLDIEVHDQDVAPVRHLLQLLAH
jgi:hypothetical protein